MKNWVIGISLFLFAVVLYALTLKGVPGNIQGYMIKNNLDQAAKPLELSPERGRFILTMSLAENNSFSLSDELKEAAAPDVGVKDGRWYILFAPGISLMAVPFYTIGKLFQLSQVFSFGMISLFAALNLVMIFVISRSVLKLPVWAALVPALIFGFGSTSWSYAVTLYQHHVTTFLILSGFFAVWKYKQKGRFAFLWAFYVWTAYAWGVWIDYPNAIFLAPNMFYFFLASFDLKKVMEKVTVSWRLSFLVTSIVFILLMVLHGYYNQVNFGSWKTLSGSITGYKEYQDQLKRKKTVTEKHANVVKFFREDATPKGFSILLFSRDRGMFLYAPIFILGLLGIIVSLKPAKLERNILLAGFLVNLLLYSSWDDPWGGWAYGPRYLIPTMALLSLFAGIWLAKFKKDYWSKITTFILFIYSSAIALLGALTTNAVPPKIEADYLKMKYNFLHNYDFFTAGHSSSFVFNTYLNKFVTFQNYFYIIWGVLILIVFVLLFVVPQFEKNHES